MSREMKHSGIPWIGEIPISWEVMPHKRVMHKIKEIQEHYNGEDILSLTMRGVIVRDLDAGGKMPTSFDGYQKVYPNNLLQCLFDIDVTPRCVGLIKNEGLTSPAYSQFEMHSNAYAPYYDYLLRYMDDGKTLLHLSKNLRSSLTETDFGAIDTCVPSIIEQQKIASFLDRKCAEIDEMIALQEKIVEELKAYKQSVILEAVTKGLNPDVPMKDSGIEWIGEIPEHWEVGRMKNLCNQNPNSLSEKTDKDIEFDYVDIGSVSFEKGVFNTEHYKFSEAPSRARRKANFGDFIMSTVRTYLRAIDVIDTQEKANYIYSTGFAVLTPKAHISYKFLSYISKSQYFLEQVTTLSRGINYPSINSTDLMTICVAHPSIEEQIQISDYLDKRCTEIDNLISIKLSKIDSLKEYKKSIIYEYVTGKKEVI